MRYWRIFKGYLLRKSNLVYIILVLDDQDGHAVGQRGHRAARGQAPPVPAVSQVILQQPPACPAHQVFLKDLFCKVRGLS